MRKYSLIFLLVIFLTISVFISACFPIDQLPYLKQQSVLFKDNFSDPRSGWSIVQNDFFSTNYHQGKFWIIVNSPQTKAWSRPGMRFQDVVVQVSAQKITGENQNNYGVICRYQNSKNFYSFLIGADGYYGISRTLDGKEELLQGRMLTFSEIINQKDGENHIEVKCLGNQLSLTINQSLLSTVTDDSLKVGDIALFAETRTNNNISVAFDDLLIINP